MDKKRFFTKNFRQINYTFHNIKTSESPAIINKQNMFSHLAVKMRLFKFFIVILYAIDKKLL